MWLERKQAGHESAAFLDKLISPQTDIRSPGRQIGAEHGNKLLFNILGVGRNVLNLDRPPISTGRSAIDNKTQTETRPIKTEIPQNAERASLLRLPVPLQYAFGDKQVPARDEFSRLPLPLKVSRLGRRQRPKAVEVFIFDHQRLAVLFQEKTGPRRGEGRAQVLDIGDHGIEVEELDHLQGTPDLLPSSALIRRVEDIDQRPLQARYPHETPGVPHFAYAAAEVRKSPERGRHQDGNELTVLEKERPEPLLRAVMEFSPQRLGFPVKLQRGVVSDNGIVLKLGTDKIRVDIGHGRFDTPKKHRIKPAPYP